MIVARGSSAKLTLEGGRVLRPAGSLLHDETGERMPKDVVVIGSFKRTGKPVADAPAHVRRHFGDATPLRGSFALPPLERGWTLVGRLKEIEYERRGQYAGRWHHGFGARRLLVFRGKALPRVYRRGRSYKIEGAAWDWRGALG